MESLDWDKQEEKYEFVSPALPQVNSFRISVALEAIKGKKKQVTEKRNPGDRACLPHRAQGIALDYFSEPKSLGQKFVYII